MRIRQLVAAGINAALVIAVTVGVIGGIIGSATPALAASPSSSQPTFLKLTPDGKVQPFSLNDVELRRFVEEYSKFRGTPVYADWKFITGKATLHLQHPISQETLDEFFHLVLSGNGHAALEVPGGKGLMIYRQRDARDLNLPVYDSDQVPDTYRLVTAVFSLKHLDASDTARTLRSVTPPQSRVLPVGPRRLLITDSGKNCRKVATLLRALDTEEAVAQGKKINGAGRPPTPQCPERVQKIDKVVVGKLEMPVSQEPVQQEIKK